MTEEHFDTTDYEALAEQLTDPAVPIKGVGPALRGEDAAAAGRAFLLREYGSAQAIHEAMKTGRPRVGAEKGSRSPVVRGSITDEDYDAFEQLRRVTGKTQSELVREAVHSFLAAHQKAS